MRCSAPCSALPTGTTTSARSGSGSASWRSTSKTPRASAEALAEVEPDEVYHLASASFVPASWDDPVGTSTAAVAAVSALLEGIRQERPEARFVNAASGEVFGAPNEIPQTESTPVAPLTPYGAAKAFGHFLTGAFRRRHGLHASSAILYNHESPRRPPQFLTRKVTPRCCRDQPGARARASRSATSRRSATGAIAGDYVRALRLMAAREEPDDFLVATGEAHTVEEFVAAAFDEVGLRMARPCSVRRGVRPRQRRRPDPRRRSRRRLASCSGGKRE